MNKPDWEKEFTQLVSKAWIKGLWHSENVFMRQTKDFILYVLTSQKQEWIERVEGKLLEAKAHYIEFGLRETEGEIAALEAVIQELKK